MQQNRPRSFTSFAEFYPYYLSEHKNRTSRRLHLCGTLAVLSIAVCTLFGVISAWWLLALPVCGYGFAWLGHFVFEKNRPATFQHPFYSLAGDFVMFKDMLIGRIAW